jgi:hypothetical protein
MPRTKSTATMLACKRDIKVNEPFDHAKSPHYNKADDTSYMYMLKTLTDYTLPNDMIEQMNHPNSVTKVFGHYMDRCYSGRSWLESARETHEVFILLRDFRETVLSEILALNLGFTKQSEKEEKEFIVNNIRYYGVTNTVSNFLRFFPKNGKIVTYETLPEDTFDRSRVTLEEQHSMKKLHLIKNLDEVEKNIHIIMSYYRTEWKDVTGLDIYDAL